MTFKEFYESMGEDERNFECSGIVVVLCCEDSPLVIADGVDGDQLQPLFGMLASGTCIRPQ